MNKKGLFRFLERKRSFGGELNVSRFNTGNQSADRVYKEAAAQDGDKG